MRRAAIAAALLGVVAGGIGGRAARADGVLAFQYDASYRHAVERPSGETDRGDAVDGVATVGTQLRLAASPWPIGWAGEVDFHLGASYPGGFAYEVDLCPLGIGMQLGRSGLAGVSTGIGVSGITGRLPVAAQIPVAAFLELGIGGRARLLLFGQASWVLRDAREGGAPRAPLGDELAGGIGIRIGRRYDDDGSFYASNGYFVGAVYSEQLGSAFAGLAVGYSLDISAR